MCRFCIWCIFSYEYPIEYPIAYVLLSFTSSQHISDISHMWAKDPNQVACMWWCKCGLVCIFIYLDIISGYRSYINARCKCCHYVSKWGLADSWVKVKDVVVKFEVQRGASSENRGQGKFDKAWLWLCVKPNNQVDVSSTVAQSCLFFLLFLVTVLVERRHWPQEHGFLDLSCHCLSSIMFCYGAPHPPLCLSQHGLGTGHEFLLSLVGVNCDTVWLNYDIFKLKNHDLKLRSSVYSSRNLFVFWLQIYKIFFFYKETQLQAQS